MAQLDKLHEKVKNLIEEINALTSEKTSNTIVFFEKISITINFLSSGACFNELINWSYALFIEVCGPNIKFFEERMKANGNMGDNLIVPKLVHTLRTTVSHNLDLNKLNDVNKIKFTEEWYNQVIHKVKPITDGDYDICSEAILSLIIDYLEVLLDCIKIDSNSEFFEDIILQEWQRRNDRHYTNYDFECVLVDVLRNYEIDMYFDANKITKREIDKWRLQTKDLQDGFDFKVEAGRIVTKYILDQKYSPVDQKDLIDNGAEKGKKLMDLHQTLTKEFYNNPRSKTDLIAWAKAEGLL